MLLAEPPSLISDYIEAGHLAAAVVLALAPVNLLLTFAAPHNVVAPCEVIEAGLGWARAAIYP